MSEVFPQFDQPVGQAWAPREQARGWLLLGCVAVLLDAGLSSAGLAASLFEGDAAGLSPSRCLEWLAVVPQLGVLMAFLTLAREAEHKGLWKGSAGFFGAMALSLVYELATDESLPMRLQRVAAVMVGFGLAGLVVVAFLTLPKIGPRDPAAAKGKGCLAGAIVPIIFVIAKVAAKIPRLKLNVETWILIEGGLLAVLGTAYVLWFASAKIRLADKLGSVALWLGAFEILVLVGALLGVLSFLAVAAPFLGAQADANNAQFERLTELWIRGGTVASIAAYVVWAALAAWLFLSVRNRGQRDWRFEFSDGGIRPWDAPRSDFPNPKSEI